MKQALLLSFCFISLTAAAQELYVFTEPASNVPARSMNLRLATQQIRSQAPYYRNMQRWMPSVSLGLSAKWMLSAGLSFADMHTNKFRWESVWLYGKYRFFSNDDLHSHFRLAAFADLAYTRSPFHFDEVNLQGDKDGAQLGLVATQLWHKLALSGSVSHTQVLHRSRTDKVLYLPPRTYQTLNYTFSAGYLLLPKQYSNYRQTNLNLYCEWLAQQSLDQGSHYIDMAPAIQLIFNSTTKVNLGYRFQLSGTMDRMARNSWLLSAEYSLLGLFQRSKK
ncbi:MAG: hypothetical protein ACK4E0_11150 [Chitinophagaceae bacterium]